MDSIGQEETGTLDTEVQVTAVRSDYENKEQMGISVTYSVGTAGKKGKHM
jgi:hypothetical protein